MTALLDRHTESLPGYSPSPFTAYALLVLFVLLSLVAFFFFFFGHGHMIIVIFSLPFLVGGRRISCDVNKIKPFSNLLGVNLCTKTPLFG